MQNEINASIPKAIKLIDLLKSFLFIKPECFITKVFYFEKEKTIDKKLNTICINDTFKQVYKIGFCYILFGNKLYKFKYLVHNEKTDEDYNIIDYERNIKITEKCKNFSVIDIANKKLMHKNKQGNKLNENVSLQLNNLIIAYENNKLIIFFCNFDYFYLENAMFII